MNNTKQFKEPLCISSSFSTVLFSTGSALFELVSRAPNQTCYLDPVPQASYQNPVSLLWSEFNQTGRTNTNPHYSLKTRLKASTVSLK